jgi:hypothetical protein
MALINRKDSVRRSRGVSALGAALVFTGGLTSGVLVGCSSQGLSAAQPDRGINRRAEAPATEGGWHLDDSLSQTPSQSIDSGVIEAAGYSYPVVQHTPVEQTLRRMLRRSSSMPNNALSCSFAKSQSTDSSPSTALFTVDSARCTVSPDSILAEPSPRIP